MKAEWFEGGLDIDGIPLVITAAVEPEPLQGGTVHVLIEIAALHPDLADRIMSAISNEYVQHKEKP